MDLASSSFTPASRAAELGMLAGVQREAERLKLTKAQTNLSASLAAQAPEWSKFKQLVEDLSNSLRNTQNVSSLTADVISLSSVSVPGECDRPRETLDAMRESKRITRNLSMLSRVRDVAEKMKTLRERDVTPRITNMSSLSSVSTFVSAAAAAAANAPSSVSGGDARSLAHGMTVPDFVAHARDIAAARLAASDESLTDVDALLPVHEELKQRHSSMQSELQTLVLYGVYGVPQSERNDEPVSRTTDSFMSTGNKNFSSKLCSGVNSNCMASTFLPSLPLAPPDSSTTCGSVPNPAGFLSLPPPVLDALPQIVQALDILSGDGHSCKIIQGAARTKAHAIVEHSIRTEMKLADGSNTEVEIMTNAKKRRVKLFTSDAPSATQKLACAVMNRISFHFLAILRRVDSLAFSLDKENINVYGAVTTIRQQLIMAFLFVIDLLLGRRTNDASIQLSDNSTSRSASTMLLNEYPENVNEIQIGGDTNTGMKQKETSEFWLSSPLISLLNAFPLTIYNLELMYGVLHRFAREYERIFTAYSSMPSSFVTLYSHLNSLKEILLHNLKQDLRLYVKTIISTRAGSLLQSVSPLKKRTQRSNSVVLAPPHVEPLAHAVAVCMRIAISIPDIAQLVGFVVANDVLLTLNQRSMEAVKLATQWTDAGRLANLMNIGHDEFEFEGDTICSPRSERERSLPAYYARSREVESFRDHVKSITGNKNNPSSDSFALLSQEEWRAIVRLIFGLNGFVNEIRKWCVDVEACRNGCEGNDTSFVPRWSTAIFSSFDNNNETASPLEKLRLLVGKGSKENALVSTVHAVLQPIENAVLALERDVVIPAVELLRAETMLRCYWLAFRSLREVATACKSGARRRKVARNSSWRTSAFSSELSRENSLDDCASICDDISARLWEFDEYGDRIPQSENSNDVKEAFGENSSKSSSSTSTVAEAKTLTIAENRMVGIARNASAELSLRFAVSKSNLTHAQQDEIVGGVDIAIAAGIRSVPRRDRAMAVASRILLQTLMVEHENLAGECTAEQCRALMYASGMV